jgi:hypothetical protein
MSHAPAEPNVSSQTSAPAYSLDAYVEIPMVTPARKGHQRTYHAIDATKTYRILETPFAISPARTRELAALAGAHVSGWLPLDVAAGAIDGYDITVHERSNDRVVAWATVIKAERSEFAHRSGFSDHDLRESVVLTRLHVDPSGDQQTLIALLGYAAARRGRLWRRHEVVAHTVAVASRDTDLFDMQILPQAELIHVGGLSFAAKASRVDAVLHRTFARLAVGAEAISSEYLASELLDDLYDYFDRMWHTSWFNAIYEGRLARQQYVYTLIQTYQFVQWTTRLLGRCVAASSDRELRTHFINHLSGEVNHEIIIERDMEHLGEDTSFMISGSAPNIGNREFMAAQESSIGFYNDPVMLMATPLAAEGLAAHMDAGFVDALIHCVEKWGVSEPAKAIRFFTSHITFDGGDDGHWISTVHSLARHLTTEARLAMFISTLRLATEGQERAYNSYVDDLPTWSARPHSRRE